MTRVEAAQLESVVAELRDSDGSLRQVFSGVTGLLEKLSGDGLMLREFTGITASVNGSVQGLLDSLDEIRRMVAATLATTEMAENSVLPVRNATEGLTNTVQGVAHEMHLIALNAQIQAIQMGEGTGLDVLAAHSAEVSQATTRISIEVASKVSEVAETVAEYSERLSALRAAGQRQQAELEEKGQIHETALHRFRDQTLDEFRAAGKALDAARELGGGIVALLDLRPAMQSVAEVQGSLAELQRESEALERTFAAGRSSEVNLSSLQMKYTMDSERRVHLEAMGQGVAAAPAVQSAELWDEGELWNQEETPQREDAAAFEATEASETADEFGEGVELF